MPKQKDARLRFLIFDSGLRFDVRFRILNICIYFRLTKKILTFRLLVGLICIKIIILIFRHCNFSDIITDLLFVIRLGLWLIVH